MRFLIPILLFVFSGTLLAQDKSMNSQLSESGKWYVSPTLGVNFSTFRYSDQVLQEYDNSIFPRLLSGLEFQYNIDGLWGIHPGVYYLGRGQKIEDDFNYTYKSRYIDFRFPVSFKFFRMDNPDISLFAKAGPYLGICTGGKIMYDQSELNLSEANASKTDIGINLGIGFETKLAQKARIAMNISYALGFIDTYSDEEQSGNSVAVNAFSYNLDGNRKNRGIEVCVSVLVPLKGMFAKKNDKGITNNILGNEGQEEKNSESTNDDEELENEIEIIINDKNEIISASNINQLTNKGSDELGGMIVTFEDVLFEVDKATLNETAKLHLNSFANILNDKLTLKIEINGYTDSTGTKEYNQELSEKRAKAVFDYLLINGIIKSRMSFQGHGEDNPIELNTTPEGRQKNRRVEILIINQD